MKNIILASLLVLIGITSSLAQRGKDGPKVVGASEVVNAYTTLNNNAGVGNTAILVGDILLNIPGLGNLEQGDLIMIYQPQGAQLVTTNPGSSPNWGDIFNYNQAGNYDIVEVVSVSAPNLIVFDCPLTNFYNTAGNPMVIRVPRYTSLTVNNGGTVTCPAWNGTTGGVVAIEVDGTTTINSGGSIDVSAMGFRGGDFDFQTLFGGGQYANVLATEGGEKGEGIGGDQNDYNSMGGEFCRGAAANGGGGGTAHNAGGGGGSNAGNLATWNLGSGVPNPTFNTSWGLETPSLVGVVSSGGGRGGYSHCGDDGDELNEGPGHPNWLGDTRRQVGGLGGRPLDYTGGKIFMGGGGGAGDGEDNTQGATPGPGGNGAGIVFMMTYGDVNGAGNITANGQDGGNCEDPNPTPTMFTVTGKDAAGGAGGGGAVIVKTTGTVSGITITANGGNGGNQVLKSNLASIGEAEGPGGGGGGGYIAITAGSPTTLANGGFNGTTNSNYVSQFNANGATDGGVGLPNESIDAFDVTIRDTTICSGDSVALTAAINGTLPGGSVVQWYDAEYGGTLLFTGNTFTTPALTADTTYYIKVCPAPFTISVDITVTNCAVVNTSFSASDSTICVGDCIDFTDLSTGTPTGWSWHFFGAATTTSSAQNPTNICYNNAGSFDVALVATDGVTLDSLFMPNFITVSPLPTVTASVDTAICLGDTANISVSGTATTYNWDNSLGNGTAFSVTPIVNTTYNVTGTDANGCVNTDSVVVTINALPTVTASIDTAICLGDTANISASGSATSYLWDNSLGAGSSFAVTPTVNTTYNVVGTDGNGCTNTDSVVVTINALPTVTASVDTAICLGDTANISASGSATSYLWDNSLGAGSAFAVTPTVNTTYNVVGTDGNGCTNTDSVVVTINALPTITTSIDTTICIGDSAAISVSGNATSYNWNNGLGAGASHTPFPIVNTTYIVVGTDGNGCTSTDSVVVTVNNCSNPPVASFSSTDSTICVGDCIDFTDLSTNVPTGWSWHFFGAATTTSNAANPTNICYNTAGTFDVALVASNATGQDSLFMPNFITVNSLPTVTASNDTTICSGDQVNLSATGAVTYNWDNGLGAGQSHAPSPIVNTTYIVTGTDANGCTNTDSVVVTVNSCNFPPVAAFSASSTVVCINDCVDFTDLSSAAIPTGWMWYFEGAIPDTSTLQNPTNICYDTVGTFGVALVSSNGFGQDSIYVANYITVDSCNTPVEEPVDFVIPNVFSPNGDGENELFQASGTGIESMHLQIYNRWGELIFKTEQVNAGWDGYTTAGAQCSEGTYFYIMVVNGETYKGTITLLR